MTVQPAPYRNKLAECCLTVMPHRHQSAFFSFSFSVSTNGCIAARTAGRSKSSSKKSSSSWANEPSRAIRPRFAAPGKREPAVGGAAGSCGTTCRCPLAIRFSSTRGSSAKLRIDASKTSILIWRSRCKSAEASPASSGSCWTHSSGIAFASLNAKSCKLRNSDFSLEIVSRYGAVSPSNRLTSFRSRSISWSLLPSKASCKAAAISAFMDRPLAFAAASSLSLSASGRRIFSCGSSRAMAES